MKSIIHRENYREFSLGAKAKNLFILAEHGFPVPEFFCIRREAGKEETEQYLREHFSEGECFAVRSAARVEDGERYSYAGQFSTRLSVPLSGCWEQAQQIFAETKRAGSYAEIVGQTAPDFEIDVILQRMIPADSSGVLFTANPQGLLNEMVIAASDGAGTAVVEDRLPAAVIYYNRTDKVFYSEGRERASRLPDSRLAELTAYGERIEALFGGFQDIEFAVKDGRIYILQARPITSFPSGYRPIILDNSNIAESYPGISLPATQSFACRIYYKVFQSCLLRLCRDPETVRARDGMLQNMVAPCSGRMYYRLNSWYEILLLLPFSDRIIPIWQEMLGVREKRVEEAALQKPGRRLKARVALSFFRLLFTCPKQMEELNRYFETLIRQTDLNQCRNGQELLMCYHQLEQKLSSRWDITLVNDMYTFLYTALLKRAAGEERAGSFLSAVTGLESMEPLKKFQELVSWVRDHGGEPMGRRLRDLRDPEEADAFLREYPAFSELVSRYISLYGDRYVEELKLESRTYRTDPILLLRRIGGQADGGQVDGGGAAGRETAADRENADEKKAKAGKKAAARKGRLGTVSSHGKVPNSNPFINRIAGKAASGIRNRELSRMNRSRIFGLVRELFLRIGKELEVKGQIGETRDIFYLFFEEMEDAVRRGTDYRETICRRKMEYAGFGKLPSCSRLIFCDVIFDRKAPLQPVSLADEAPSVLYGTPSSAGTAEGEVLIVKNPSEVSGAEGRILVASTTDPGWVFLIAQARALVVEQGSLLSHTAIVTREMKKPSVVGVTNAAKYLRDGDWVKVDGRLGEITILRRKAGEGQNETD